MPHSPNRVSRAPRIQGLYTHPMAKFINIGQLPKIDGAEYTAVTKYPLFALKYAQQVYYSSGFDATWRVYLIDLFNDPDNAPTPFHDMARAFEASYLSDFALLDSGFAEEIASGFDDDMSDAYYARLHAPLEVIERFHDHNKNAFEYTFYDIVDHVMDEPQIEHQYYKTYTPMQTYLKPFNILLQHPFMACRYTNMDYYYQTYSDRIVTCVYPFYRKEKLTPQEEQYCRRILDDSVAYFNREVSYRQKSAHEIWMDLILKQAGVQLEASITNTYYSIIEDYNLDLKRMLQRIDTIFTAEEAGYKYHVIEHIDGYLYMQSDVKKTLYSILPFESLEMRVVQRILDAAYFIMDLPQCTFSLEHELQFPEDFDVSVRGLIESKSSTNAFFTLTPEQKREFIAPLIAERILTYQKMGLYSYMVRTTFIKPQNKCPCRIRALGQLSSAFLNAFRQQHNAILRDTLINMYVDQLVSSESWINESTATKKRLFVLRPVCGCYGCNLAAIYDSDTFDYSSRIYGSCLIIDSKMYAKDILHGIFGVYASDFAHYVPYFKNIVQGIGKAGVRISVVESDTYERLHPTNGRWPNCIDWGYKSQLNPDLSFCKSPHFEAFINPTKRTDPQTEELCYICYYMVKGLFPRQFQEFSLKKHKSDAVKNYEDIELLSALLIYAFLIPPFIGYKRKYAMDSTETPRVIFDAEYFRNDIMQCFSKNPHLVVFYDRDEVHPVQSESTTVATPVPDAEKPHSTMISGESRMQPRTQSCLVNRFLETAGGLPFNQISASLHNNSVLYLYLNVYGPVKLDDIDWLEETPLDIHYLEVFSVYNAKLESTLGPDLLETQIYELFLKRRLQRRTK